MEFWKGFLMLRSALLLMLLALVAPISWAQVPTKSSQMLFNGWKLSPAGHRVQINDMPLKMILSPDGKYLLAVCGGESTGVSVLDVSTMRVHDTLPLPRCWNGIAFSKDAKQVYVSGGNSNLLHVLDFEKGKLKLQRSIDLNPEDKTPRGQDLDSFLSAVAVHPVTGKIYLCNEGLSEVWAVDPSGKVESKIRTGAHPHTCLFTSDGKQLYVSNWGERTVSVIDVERGKTLTRVSVGIRPNDMALAPDGRLFVACAGDNTVHVIDTGSPLVEKKTTEGAPPPEQASEIIATSLYPDSPEGSTPDAVTVSPDGKVLFVSNADNNNVAVIDICDPKVSIVSGFVPTGWYPTAVATNGKTLFIGTGKGMGNFGPNAPAHSKEARHVAGVKFDHPTGLLQGHVSFVPEPTGAELAEFTKNVRANCPYTPETLRQTTARPGDSVIPSKVGDPCPIKYVLYIIKENRTYDQVLGDLTDSSGKRLGNGDPHLTVFGEKITPNQHQLAREYVLFDNLYCNSEVSVDGHSWCDGAIATDYRQRAWTVGYTQHGQLPGNRDMSSPSSGFLWDLCKRHGVSYRCYGEGAGQVPMGNRGRWKGDRDIERVDNWINDLQDAEKSGELPRFMIMSLGENHTAGTTPGAHSPQSCVASNDIAVGKIVEAATRSKFWPEMAIFIIEDDAQNGPDHVDSHRTAGFVISPYIKRQFVDSTPYTTTSMIRTMELILGLPPMTQYDAAATPMFKCFQKQPLGTPYKLLKPAVDLAAINKPDAPGGKASAAMNFEEYDEAPEDELNRILWRAMKGPDIPYPAPIHRALFTN